MLMLSIEGWLHGISSTFQLFIGCSFGLVLLYKSKKSNAKLLIFVSLSIIFSSGMGLGNFIDFMTILFTHNNMDTTLHSIFGYMWSGLLIISGTFIAAELLIPKKKWYIIAIYIILAFLWELFLLLDINRSVVVTGPMIPGEDIIRTAVIIGSPFFILYIIFILSMFIFAGIGFIFKALNSSGILRKKFFLISVGSFLYIFLSFVDAFFDAYFINLGTIGSYWFWYLGLREEPEKPQKPVKKEVKITESIFRLSKRPDFISEEEVTFHREKKICLVCKGKVGSYMFMCPKCDTLYCQNCAHALESLENACWVCDGPIDPTKPVRSFHKEGDEAELKVLDKTQKFSKLT